MQFPLMTDFLKCRLCSSPVENKPVLSFLNMPSVAQFFSSDISVASNQRLSIDIYQCLACGHIQLSDQILVPYFRDVIRQSKVSREMMRYRESQFASFCSSFSLSNSSYIELGCGRGEYLSIMKSSIPNSVGLEHSLESVEYCRDLDLNVIHGYLQDRPITLSPYIGKFCSFGIYNFLEHIPTPVDYLRSLHQYLAFDAVGIVEVPNFDLMLDQLVYSDFSTEHLSYFTSETLSTLLSLSGFKVLDVSPTWHNHILTAYVSRKSPLDSNSFYQKLSLDRDNILSILSAFQKNQVAFWGAGHQSLAFIAQLDMSNSIGYIVDSAPVKQNTFAPSLCIPIHHPDHLRFSPPSVLVINASSYNSEVLRIVRAQFDFISHIYSIENGALLKHS
ncbi:methyltransferase domain protein [Synechococcus sp. WH 8103]|nr:methyltransferase domain protein [Synechococcus sp. WH 8103]